MEPLIFNDLRRIIPVFLVKVVKTGKMSHEAAGCPTTLRPCPQRGIMQEEWHRGKEVFPVRGPRYHGVPFLRFAETCLK